MAKKGFNIAEIKVFSAFVRLGAIYPGPFTRKDGMVLPFWDDAQRVWSDPKIFRLCVKEFSKIVRKLKCDAVVGAATAGIPLAAAVAYATGKSFSFVRKEKKGYSARQLIDGYFPPGSKVILIDDAFVRGEMKDVFIKQIKRAGGEVKEIAVFIDIGLKQRKGWLKKRLLKLRALYNWPQFFDYLYQNKLITPEFYSILLQFMKSPYTWHKDKKVWQKFLRLRRYQPLWCKII